MNKVLGSTSPLTLTRLLSALTILCASVLVQAHAQQSGGNQIDTSFGRDGRVVTPFDPANPTGQNNVARLALIQPDGRILAVGVGHYNDGRGAGAAVIRYLPDGQVDASFGNQGRALLFPSIYNNDGLAAALQPDGRIVVAGPYFQPETSRTAWAVARLTADGQPDASFGAGGVTVLDITPGSESPLALRVEADGKILAAGSAGDAARSFALARFNPDGQPDATFAPSGFRLSTFFGPSGVVTKALFLSDGRVAVAGPVNTGTGDDIGVARYLSDGNPDPGSLRSITDTLNSYQDVVGGMAEGPNGGLVVCGWVTPPAGSGTPGDMTVVRYNLDGTLDQTFGAGGKVVTDIIGGHDYARAVVAQADGKIVAVGDSANPFGSDVDFTLVRYNADGSLDSGFGSDGEVRTDVGTAEGQPGTGDLGYGVAVQPDGRIVVTGSVVVWPRVRHDFGLVRYHGGPAPEPTPTPTPTPTPAPALSTLTLNPTSVAGGGSSLGTVTLTAAALSGGAVVTLSDNSAATMVPSSVTVPAGATSAVFNVLTTSVTATTSATISAAYNGVTRAATLTVNTPATDTVAVQRAEYTTSKRQLRIDATSTNTGAVLKVYVTSTNQLIGTLTRSGGKYSGQFSWQTNPQSVTVRSSLGGSATRAVSAR